MINWLTYNDVFTALHSKNFIMFLLQIIVIEMHLIKKVTQHFLSLYWNQLKKKKQLQMIGMF